MLRCWRCNLRLVFLWVGQGRNTMFPSMAQRVIVWVLAAAAHIFLLVVPEGYEARVHAARLRKQELIAGNR